MKRVIIFVTLVLLVTAGVVLGQTQSSTRQTPQADGDSSPGIMGRTGRAIKDSWITSKTKAKLIAEKRVTRAVSVETQAGVVTLRGKVASPEEKGVAEQVAHGTDGVKVVRNNLQIVPDARRTTVDAQDKNIKKAVKARFDKEAVVKDAGISVRADDGMVTLMGSVADARTSTRAADLAKGINGVRAVRNELKVSVAKAAR
jgi:hyperosmotically inducible protein